jgi:hypothetical protein
MTYRQSAGVVAALVTTPFAAARRVAVVAGRPRHCRQQALHKDGVAAVLAPAFARKRATARRPARLT